MGRVLGALTHWHPVPRAITAVVIAVGLWLAAWTISYLLVGEGALREVMSVRVPGEVLTTGPSLGMTIFSWNLLFGVGSIVVSSLFAVRRVSLGYFAPWWWALAYGIALGTNSFVLTVPGKLAPDLSVLWQHIGAREILAYILVASALANVHVWTARRWHDLKLARVRSVSEVRLRTAEIACIGVALTLLAWTATVEAAGVARFLSRN